MPTSQNRACSPAACRQPRRTRPGQPGSPETEGDGASSRAAGIGCAGCFALRAMALVRHNPVLKHEYEAFVARGKPPKLTTPTAPVHCGRAARPRGRGDGNHEQIEFVDGRDGVGSCHCSGTNGGGRRGTPPRHPKRPQRRACRSAGPKPGPRCRAGIPGRGLGAAARQARSGMKTPAELWFRHARTAPDAGYAETVATSVVRCLEKAGRRGASAGKTA